MIGFYQVKNTKSETLFNIIKVSWVELTINEFQSYDRASKMGDTKTGVATRINEIESHAHLTHCHGHALQLAITIMRAYK